MIATRDYQQFIGGAWIDAADGGCQSATEQLRNAAASMGCQL